MGRRQNCGPFLGTLNIGVIGTILGFYGDNGKENGNYYIGVIYPISPFLGTLNFEVPYYKRHPKRDQNFDNHPYNPNIYPIII